MIGLATFDGLSVTSATLAFLLLVVHHLLSGAELCLLFYVGNVGRSGLNADRKRLHTFIGGTDAAICCGPKLTKCSPSRVVTLDKAT